MRTEVEATLRNLSDDELVETRRLVNGILSGRGRPLHHPPAGVAERRRFPRFVVNLQASYSRDRALPEGTPAEAALHEAIVKDISRGGVGFFTDEKVEIGEMLTFYLPGESGVRKLFVEIRRAVPRGGQFECGGAFVGLDRVLAARRLQGHQDGVPGVIVVAGVASEDDALVGLVLRQGYAVELAQSVSEAQAKLSRRRSRIVLVAASLLLAEKGRLLGELHADKGNLRIIALASASDLEGPDGQALRTCHDFICEPDRAAEVQVVLDRTVLRLTTTAATPAHG